MEAWRWGCSTLFYTDTVSGNTSIKHENNALKINALNFTYWFTCLRKNDNSEHDFLLDDREDGTDEGLRDTLNWKRKLFLNAPLRTGTASVWLPYEGTFAVSHTRWPFWWRLCFPIQHRSTSGTKMSIISYSASKWQGLHTPMQHPKGIAESPWTQCSLILCVRIQLLFLSHWFIH